VPGIGSGVYECPLWIGEECPLWIGEGLLDLLLSISLKDVRDLGETKGDIGNVACDTLEVTDATRDFPGATSRASVIAFSRDPSGEATRIF
jgi:hypothetical protein